MSRCSDGNSTRADGLFGMRRHDQRGNAPHRVQIFWTLRRNRRPQSMGIGRAPLWNRLIVIVLRSVVRAVGVVEPESARDLVESARLVRPGSIQSSYICRETPRMRRVELVLVP